MKKFALIICVLFISNVCVIAQSPGFSVGARAGLSIPKIQAKGDNPMSQGYKSRLAAGGGIFAEIHFNDHFSLRPAVEFSGQGGKRDGRQAIPSRMLSVVPAPIREQMPQYLYADFDSETSFDYLMVPVLAQYSWRLGKTSPFRVYVNAGPFISFLLSANQTTSGKSEVYLNKAGTKTLDDFLHGLGIGVTVGSVPLNYDESIKSETNSINYGFSGNAGLAYQLKEKHTIFIEGGGSYGFRVMQKDAANGQNRIGVGTVMLGYSYRFK